MILSIPKLSILSNSQKKITQNEVMASHLKRQSVLEQKYIRLDIPEILTQDNRPQVENPVPVC